ncbi:MAG: protein phosphatase 2C domain-containing protein [Chloroflexi bacterium]|nr:protein phosphatase 2C domain-containing protein [Chloroflexota bacterium]
METEQKTAVIPTNFSDPEEPDQTTVIIPIDLEEADADQEIPLLSPGLLLNNRYKIIEQLPAADMQLPGYTGHDLGRCSACAYEQPYAIEDDFCPACGVLLDKPALCHIQQVPPENDPPTENALSLTHDGLTYLVQSSAVEEETAENPRYFRLRYGFQSDKGQVREVDEDSLLTLTMTAMFEGECETTLGLFVVSDGIGGHQAGEIASRQAVELISHGVLTRVFQRSASAGPTLSENYLKESLIKAVEVANSKIHETQQESGNDMGATVTAVLIHNQNAVIANIGDSRTYLWRGGELTALTQDHSLVASLIAAQELPEDAIYTHEQKGMIYRSLGDKPTVEIDTFPLTLLPEDRLILCCDGVWEMLRNEGIEEVLLLEHDPQRACDEMVKRANYAGGDDNISVIIVVIEPVNQKI